MNSTQTKSYTLKKLEIDIIKFKKEQDKLDKSITEHDSELNAKKERLIKIKEDLVQLNILKNCL